jgi:hypothetical protein
MHIASPLPGSTSVQHILDVGLAIRLCYIISHPEQIAKEGTLHILKEAIKAGIEKVVITSSYGTMMTRTLPCRIQLSVTI